MYHADELTVIITDGVMCDCIEWTDEDTNKQQIIQTTEGRLQEVLYKLQLALKKALPATDSFLYEISVVLRDGKSNSTQQIKLLAVTDDGDNGESIITVMLPNEY